jgi:protein CpxP
MKKSLLLAVLALATTSLTHAQTTAPVKVTGSDAKQTAMHEEMMAKPQSGPKAGHKPGKTPAQKADHKATKMAKELGLNADQENKVEQILLAENQEMQALHAKAVGTHGISPEMKTARAKYNGQLKAVLTPEQFTKLEAKRSEHLKEHGGKMKMKG